MYNIDMAPEQRTELIAARIGPGELKMLTELAEADGVSKAHVIRLLIRRAHAERFGAQTKTLPTRGKSSPRRKK